MRFPEIHTTKIFWSFVSVLDYLVGSSETRRFTKNRYELYENQTICKKHRRCVWLFIASTLNPGDSRLFTWVRFLTPIIYFFISMPHKNYHETSYCV